MLHSEATSDCTVTIDNCVFYGNNGSQGDGLSITKSLGSGFDLTVTIRNSIFNNQEDDDEIRCDVGTDLSITYCDITGGEDAVTGADIYTDNINSDPLFISASDFQLQWNSPAIDYGTDVSLASDYSGNSIYSVPDMGAYEYQPPYTIGTDDIPTTGSIRIYSDGKYRTKTASTTSATTTFSITPASGSYMSTTTQYMDITINTWNTTGNYAKQWTATSTAGNFLTQATTTIYTIGDLLANTAYTFKVDGTASTTAIIDNVYCSSGVCTADADGQIQFTYTGGYSTHTFGLEDITAPTLTQDTTISSPTNDNTPSYLFHSDEAGSVSYSGGCASITDTVLIGTTTITLNELSDGTYNCAITVTDSAGNASIALSIPEFIIDTGEAELSAGSPNSALSAGTTQATLSLTTNETATCKYSTTPNTAYSSMTVFSNTDNTTHSTAITGLTNGTSYNYYIKCQDETGNANSSDYTISFSVSSAGGGMPFWMLNQINNANKTDGSEKDSRLRGNDNKNNHFAYSKTRLKSLPQEQNSAKELKQKLEEFYSKGKIPVHKKHWHTIVNSYIYGDYPIQAIIQAIKFGGKTVHPIIPFSAWQKAKDYLEWIGR